METRTQKHTGKAKNYTDVIVMSATANNTGPVRIFRKSYNIKFGKFNEWMAANPTFTSKLEVTLVVNHVYES